MPRKLSLVLLLFCFKAMPAFAQDAETGLRISIPAPKVEVDDAAPTKFKGEMYGAVLGQDFQDRYLQSESSLTIVSMRFDAIYNSWLSFNLGFSGLFQEGNTKNFYNTEGESTDVVLLDEAAMTLKPFEGLEIRGGALLSSINPIMSVETRLPFVGSTQKYEFATLGKDFSISLMTEEAVPSSGTVTHGLVDDAPNAFFLTQTLSTSVNIHAISTKITAATTHFEFGNLSSNVASDSILIGNSPSSFTGIGPTTQYTIGFGGFETGLQLETDWSKMFTTIIKGSTIKNTEAPSDRNSGQQAQLNLVMHFNRVNIIPMYRLFYVESDVTPATYTILPNRYQDRQGYMLGFRVELKREKVAFLGNYTRANVITADPYLADRDMYNIGVEANYDLF